MSSGTSDVRDALEGYLAGLINADRLATVVAAAYYGEWGKGNGEWLRSVIEVIEKVAPGTVELARSDSRAGFQVTPRERAFPRQHESDLRAAVEVALGVAGTGGGAQRARAGLWTRVWEALRRLMGRGR